MRSFFFQDLQLITVLLLFHDSYNHDAEAQGSPRFENVSLSR